MTMGKNSDKAEPEPTPIQLLQEALRRVEVRRADPQARAAKNRWDARNAPSKKPDASK
jgi:hypothetical protein